MQQFNVPQFIDVEDKVMGPVTARQFVILLGCAVLGAIAYKLFSLLGFIVATVIIFILGSILAFMKINGRPFHFFILNLFQTLKKPKIRVWNNQLAKTKAEISGEEVEVVVEVAKIQKKPIYAKSKLAELSLIVDTGGVYQGGDEKIEIINNKS